MWQAIGGMVQAGLGIYQAVEGANKLQQSTRPTYKRPKESAEALALARAAAGDPNMPGQTTLQDRLDMQSANAYNQASMGGNPLASIAGIQASQQAAQQNLGLQAAQWQRGDMQNFYDKLGKSAQYTDMEFQMNKYAPYADEQAEGRDMIGAGTKNAFGGMDETFGAMDAYMGNSGMSGTGTDTTGDTSDTWAKWNKDSGNKDPDDESDKEDFEALMDSFTKQEKQTAMQTNMYYKSQKNRSYGKW